MFQGVAVQYHPYLSIWSFLLIDTCEDDYDTILRRDGETKSMMLQAKSTGGSNQPTDDS